jgi:phospho-N-acetylmuramoyl-pentapeptide-transferase
MLARLLIAHPLLQGAGVRSALAAATALAVCVAAGRPTIAWLRSQKVGEKTEKTPIDDPVLRARIAAKSGTPTMGGLMVLGALVVSCLLWVDLRSVPVLLALSCTLALGALGAVDDLHKLHRTGRGVKVRHKLLFQAIVGLSSGLLLARYAHSVGADAGLMSPSWARAGSLAVVALSAWGAFFVTGMSNATNVTDGLDGLLAGLAAPAAAVLALGCLAGGMPEVAEVGVFCAALAGACLGFLGHNRHPARVFMGDTGALAIGGGLAVAAMAARRELLLAVVGIVFVIELTSSGLQIAAIRLLGRRVLPVAPVHHVFQRRGDAEPRIVLGFHACGIAAALAGLGILWF